MRFIVTPSPTTEIYTLSLHDALPICVKSFKELIYILKFCGIKVSKIAIEIVGVVPVFVGVLRHRSEEHTSELQSQSNLVCRLLLEKKHIRSPHVRPGCAPRPYRKQRSEGA